MRGDTFNAHLARTNEMKYVRAQLTNIARNVCKFNPYNLNNTDQSSSQNFP